MVTYGRFCSALIIALSCLASATTTQELLSDANTRQYGFQQSGNAVHEHKTIRVAIVGKLRYFR